MWLKSARLKNIKCFEDIELIFTHKQNATSNAKPHHWITILGENGVGKTTVLQAIGLLLAGPEAAKEMLPRPAGWVRDPAVRSVRHMHIDRPPNRLHLVLDLL